MIRPDSLPIRFLSKVCDLIFLNLLFVLSCATLICSGTGLTALYTVTLKMVRGKDYAPLKGFLRAARDSFIPSAPAAVLFLLDVTLIMYLRHVLYADELLLPPELFILLAMAAAALTAVLGWLFPLLAAFDNTFSRHLVNAARLALAHLPVTCLITLVDLLPLLLALLFPAFLGQIAAFWLLIGLAGGAFVNSFYLARIFDARGG